MRDGDSRASVATAFCLALLTLPAALLALSGHVETELRLPVKPLPRELSLAPALPSAAVGVAKIVRTERRAERLERLAAAALLRPSDERHWG